MYGREVKMPGEAPSLLRLSLFAVKEPLVEKNNSNDDLIPPAELEGLDHLAELINQNRI
jgi:hypothetical protein